MNFEVHWTVRGHLIEWKFQWRDMDQAMKFACKQLRDQPSDLTIEDGQGKKLAGLSEVVAWGREHDRLPPGYAAAIPEAA